MPINASARGSFGVQGRFGGLGGNDIYQPPGTSRVLAISFNGNTITRSPDSTDTIAITGSLSTPTSGGLFNGGYVTGFSAGGGTGDGNVINGLRDSTLSNVAMNGVNYTFIAWYKGTQTATASDNIPRRYSPTVPIFGDPRGSVYMGFGLDGGKIAISENQGYRNGPNVADGNWHMLTWTFDSSNRVNAWVDGYQWIYNYKVQASPLNNRLDYIGIGYNYSGVLYPSQLDGVQIYNQILTDAQIKDIYTKINGSITDNRIYRRYWRWRMIGTTEGHPPRVSRYLMRDASGVDYTTTSYTSDNCSDSGNIDYSGITSNYDAGAGNTKAMVGAGLYTSYSGPRGAWGVLEYSSDGSSWNELGAGDLRTFNGCGIYLTNGVTP